MTAHQPTYSRQSLVVVSDLDGTLLDHATYDWSAAVPALAALGLARIPLVLASSKTRAEMEIWRARLWNRHPFVIENGAAIIVPGEIMGRVAEGEVEPETGDVRIEFGIRYDELRRELHGLASQLGFGLRGFGDLRRNEVARLTGLDGQELDAALSREFDEPFVADPPLGREEENRLAERAKELGLRISRGGRFYHLSGLHHKGVGIGVLREIYRGLKGDVFMVAIGDGGNDLELLQEADLAVVVARPDGSHADLLAGIPSAWRTNQIGPAGFNEAIVGILANAL